MGEKKNEQTGLDDVRSIIIVATADLYKAIVAAWVASGLNATFKAMWDNPADTSFPVLNDQEATPRQPYPYCVMDQPSGRVTSRMSGGVGLQRNIRDVTMRFNIHTLASGVMSAKEAAAYLAEEVMKVFGGHPTTPHTQTLTLDNGSWLITQYQNDFGVRTGDAEHQWVIEYIFRLDVPVAV